LRYKLVGSEVTLLPTIALSGLGVPGSVAGSLNRLGRVWLTPMRRLMMSCCAVWKMIGN
jgi:hypothetical protein